MREIGQTIPPMRLLQGLYVMMHVKCSYVMGAQRRHCFGPESPRPCTLHFSSDHFSLGIFSSSWALSLPGSRALCSLSLPHTHTLQANPT